MGVDRNAQQNMTAQAEMDRQGKQTVEKWER
jgi:hypothetical protein